MTTTSTIDAPPKSWEEIRQWIADAPFADFDSAWVAVVADEVDSDYDTGLKNLCLTMIQVRERYRRAGTNAEAWMPASPSLDHVSIETQILAILRASPVPLHIDEIRSALPKHRLKASTVCSRLSILKSAGKIQRVCRSTYTIFERTTT